MVVRSNCCASPWLVMRNPPLSMISAVVASLFSSNSRNALPICSTSSSVICGKVAMSCVLRSCLANELVQQHARDHVERLKHAFAPVRRGAEGGNLEVAVVQQKLHVFHRGDIRQITLVILQHVRNVGEIEPQSLQIILQIREALHRSEERRVGKE